MLRQVRFTAFRAYASHWFDHDHCGRASRGVIAWCTSRPRRRGVLDVGDVGTVVGDGHLKDLGDAYVDGDGAMVTADMVEREICLRSARVAAATAAAGVGHGFTCGSPGP